MIDFVNMGRSKLEHEGSQLARIHSNNNYRKAVAYWLGFLKGTLASERIEHAEYGPLKVEAENFLRLLHDPDAMELIDDLRIWEREPKEIYEIIETIVSIRSREFIIENQKDEINEMFGFCAGIACDNHITPREVESLIQRLESYPRIKEDKRAQNLKRVCKLSIADGRITPDEEADICSWITKLVGDSATDTGIATFGNVGVLEDALSDASQLIFEARMFVLTGKFALGPRKAIEGMIGERGGGSKAMVCRNTDYLCVAAEASRDWRHSHEGLKIMRALELRAEGRGPALVHEVTLSQALSS